MTEFTAEELEDKTPEQLATLGERNHPLSAEGILIKNEQLRRLLSSDKKKRQWYEKPSGALLIGIAASLLAAALWYFYGPH